MYIGALPPVSNREDLEIDCEITDDETGDLIDLTGAVIVFEVRDHRCSTVLSATTTNGKITIPDTGTFIVAFAESEMNELPNDTYEWGCTLLINGGTRQLGIGTVPVLDGVVSR